MPDAVVIGSGPNGLVAANILADQGWSVTVLEAADEWGGAVRSAELTLPGFRHDLFSAFYPLALASKAIAALELERYGLVWCHAPAVLAHPFPDGTCASISRLPGATEASVESFAPGDGAAWREMIERWQRIAPDFLSLVLGTFPPALPAARLLRKLGALDSMRLLRHALLPARRMADELFAGEGARALLGGLALHADVGPDSAGSGAYGWLLASLAQTLGFPVPRGGAGRLSDALVERLRRRGGEVLCGTRVERVVVRGGRAVAVGISDGRTIDARRAVLADVAAPRLFLDLVGAEHLPASLLDDLEHYEWDTATVKLDWALDGPVPWAAEEARDAGTVHVADDFDNLTEFSAQLAMGRLPSRPYLLFGQPARADPTRSPAGTETAWAYTHVPRHVRGDALESLPVDGWLEGFVERVETRIERLAPGFRSRVIGRHVLSPASLEAANANLVGGAIGGGSSQPHQQLVFRPVPGSGRPETPVTALYLASSSAHPGGGVHGACGRNAALAALAPFAGARSALLGRGRWRPEGAARLARSASSAQEPSGKLSLDH